MKISIITPTYNQASFLKRTAESVLGQRGAFELEWIVVDGGSTDGTVEFLGGLADPRVTWSSERDRGQAEAVNRGMGRASGEVMGWLNSDDLYAPGAIEAACAGLGERRGPAWVVGRCGIIDAEGRAMRLGVSRYKDWQLGRYSYRRLLRENFISQPAVFWTRGMWEAAGGRVDESLHYTMDYDLWLRMGRVADPIVLGRVLAMFRFHAQSKSGAVNREQFDEGFRVAERYFDGDRVSRWAHRLNVAKIVWSYRVMRAVGR